MTSYDAHAYAHYGSTSPTRTNARMLRRASTQKDLKKVEEKEIVAGRIFWLPPKEELPNRAVRRAHGKGAVEEGIYNHPIVVISRPADDHHVIHFHIITSFQGKRLHEIYSKPNEFHASRRSWYLPISPSPDHPDANSKKTRKRFPTLELSEDATLRWDSYVNLRHVYKIDWSHLRAYSNPDTPERNAFSFDRDSMIRLLAKSKVLTNYEPGPQHVFRQQPRAMSLPLRIPETQVHTNPFTTATHEAETPSPKSCSDASRCSSVIGSEYSGRSPILQSDFGSAGEADERSSQRPPRAPPDRSGRRWWEVLRRIFWFIFSWPFVVARRRWVRLNPDDDSERSAT